MPARHTVDPVVAFQLVFLVGAVLSAILGSWAWALIKLALGEPLLPRAPRRVVPWGAASVLGVLVLYIGVQALALIGYMLSRWIVSGGAMKPAEPTFRDKLLLMATINTLTAVLVPALLRLSSGARAWDLGFTSRSLGLNVARGAGVCFLILPVIYLVMFLSVQVWSPEKHLIEDALRKDRSTMTAVLAVISAVVLAPLVEEMLFRGIVLGWLLKPKVKKIAPEVAVDPFAAGIVAVPAPTEPAGADPVTKRNGMDWMANVAVSLIFASLHAGQWPAPLPLFLLSLGLGELYRKSGSLAGPIAMHATFNGLSTTVMLLTVRTGMMDGR